MSNRLILSKIQYKQQTVTFTATVINAINTIVEQRHGLQHVDDRFWTIKLCTL